MTSIVKFESISGLSEDAPLCYLLSIDGFTFLLDCGWNDTYDMEVMRRLKPHIKNIDAVLLSFPDLTHLGGLPYAVGKLGLDCPIYATLPVYEMGQMYLYDLFQSHSNYEDFNVFSLDDVDLCFQRMRQLKYSQVVALDNNANLISTRGGAGGAGKGNELVQKTTSDNNNKSQNKGSGLTIVPLNAGHILGGTMWVIKTEQEEFVYMVNFNHRKERHLAGADFKSLQSIQRPSLVITDTYSALTRQQQSVAARERQLIDLVKNTFNINRDAPGGYNGGHVLMPIDSAGRVLELALMFDEIWKQEYLIDHQRNTDLHSKSKQGQKGTYIYIYITIYSIVLYYIP